MEIKAKILKRSDINFNAENSRVNLLRILRQTNRQEVTGSQVSITEGGIDRGFPAVFATDITKGNIDVINRSIQDESFGLSFKTDARGYKGRKRRPVTKDKKLLKKFEESIGL